MKRLSMEQQKLVVEQWKRAAPELERIHREELRNYQYNSEDVDALLEIGDRFGESRSSSGMVEMQRLFMKLARRQGKLPSSLREDSVPYGSELPEAVRRRLLNRLGDDAPEGLYHHGDPTLLDQPLTAIFCSRGCTEIMVKNALMHVRKVSEEGGAVVSGFHSPGEKECLDVLLRFKSPFIFCPARSIDGMRLSKELRSAFDAGQLLLLSPFKKSHRRPDASSCQRRNNLVAALADRALVVPHEPKGEISRVLSLLERYGVPVVS